MSSVYLNPTSSSPIPNLQLNLGQILDENPNCYSDDQTCFPIEFSSHDQDLKVENIALFHEKSKGFGQVLPSPPSPPQINPILSNHGIIKNSRDHKNSKKWKPSKVRIMQKMTATSKHDKFHQNLEQGQRKLYNNNDNNNNNGVIRMCSDCHTTTTPLWRSGPQGPKSLCNACGIRQRKARRAAMAAATENGIIESIATKTKSRKPKIHEEMGERRSNSLPLKKRGKKIHHGDDKYGLINNKDFLTTNYHYNYYSKKQTLPRDEEEGAILLMALSCGLCSS